MSNNPLIYTDPSGHKVVKDTNQVTYLNGLVAKGGGSGAWAQSQLNQKIYYYDDTQGRGNQFAGTDKPTLSQQMSAMSNPNTSDDEKALLALGVAKTAVSLGVSGAVKGVVSGTKAAVSGVKAAVGFIGGLFSSEKAINTFTTGVDFESSIVSSSGVMIDSIANVSINGSKLILSDVAIYPRGAEIANSVGVRDIVVWKNNLIGLAKAQGFESIEINGMRALGSTSALPGKIVNLLINIK